MAGADRLGENRPGPADPGASAPRDRAEGRGPARSTGGGVDPAGAAGPEAVFAAAFRASTSPMVLTDARQPDHPIVFANPAFCRLTGYSAAEVLGRNCRFLQGPDTDRGAVARVRAAVSRGEPVSVDVLNYRRDGTPFWNAMALNPVPDAAGGIRSFFAVLTDVSGTRQAERALARARDDLEQDVDGRARALQAALDQQTALLHEVDHRVKNNLQVISSLVLLKARRTRDAACREALNSMAERIGALATVHRLLYSVGDVNRFNLRDFAADFGADLAAGLDPDRIRLTIDVDAIAVSASRAAPLALLVHELATNAVRHAFPGERRGRVAIVARRRADAMTLEVSDDGVGLGPHDANPEGFGRALVGMVVRQLRGSLAWEDLAPGTRARLVLPLDADEAGA